MPSTAHRDGPSAAAQRHEPTPTADAIAIDVLGDLQASGPNGTVGFGHARPGALLAMLAMAPGECVPVDRLLDELWPAPGGAAATKRVQVNVVRLRRALARLAPDFDPAALVRTRSHGYELRIDPGRIDAVRFERLVVRARVQLHAARPERATATLRSALALWRGDPYAGFTYESFAACEIRRLQELRLAALELRAEAQLALGAYATVVPELERLVAQHPFREHLHALLMVALYRSRRQGDALAAFHSARRMLIDTLGIEPGPELRDLQRAILDQLPSPIAIPRDGAASLAAPRVFQAA